MSSRPGRWRNVRDRAGLPNTRHVVSPRAWDVRPYEIMAMDAYQRQVMTFFDGRTTYDGPQLMADRALPLIAHAQISPGQSVLDVATGTGIVAIAAAQAVGTSGQVIGVDFSVGMLAQAQRKVTELGLRQVTLHQVDAEAMTWPEASFDAILCTSALAFFRDIPAALGDWRTWLKPGGVVGFTSYTETSFLAPVVVAVCADRQIPLTNINQPLGTPDLCRHMLTAAGLVDVQVHAVELGGFLPLEAAQATWNGRFWLHPSGNPLLDLPSFQVAQLQEDYCRAIAKLNTAQGVWQEITTFFVTARRPA
jgi:arsenite methyltransferase